MNMILFDIDSTLLKDGGASNASFSRAFKEMFSVDPVSIDKHGKTDPAIARETAMATLGRRKVPFARALRRTPSGLFGKERIFQRLERRH